MAVPSTSFKNNGVAYGRGDEGVDPDAEGLKCYLDRPNITMVIPWIYEIAKAMSSSSRDTEDEIEKGLEVYLNQPNINMTIPWIYKIYKSVKSGGGGGSSGIEWTDDTSRGSSNSEEIQEIGG